MKYTSTIFLINTNALYIIKYVYVYIYIVFGFLFLRSKFKVHTHFWGANCNVYPMKME